MLKKLYKLINKRFNILNKKTENIENIKKLKENSFKKKIYREKMRLKKQKKLKMNEIE